MTEIRNIWTKVLLFSLEEYFLIDFKLIKLIDYKPQFTFKKLRVKPACLFLKSFNLFVPYLKYSY